jgi:hypothetical protein
VQFAVLPAAASSQLRPRGPRTVCQRSAGTIARPPQSTCPRSCCPWVSEWGSGGAAGSPRNRRSGDRRVAEALVRCRWHRACSASREASASASRVLRRAAAGAATAWHGIIFNAPRGGSIRDVRGGANPESERAAGHPCPPRTRGFRGARPCSARMRSTRACEHAPLT